jgi:hypothetical protein
METLMSLTDLSFFDELEAQNELESKLLGYRFNTTAFYYVPCYTADYRKDPPTDKVYRLHHVDELHRFNQMIDWMRSNALKCMYKADELLSQALQNLEKGKPYGRLESLALKYEAKAENYELQSRFWVKVIEGTIVRCR